MKNKILNVITVIAVFMFALGGSSLDSEEILIPYIMVIVSGLWLLLMYLANRKESK